MTQLLLIRCTYLPNIVAFLAAEPVSDILATGDRHELVVVGTHMT